jgi:predicted ArsR family transcriptional regulator
MDLARQAAGIGALADPVRRALYEYVAAQPDAVGREAAAAAVQVPVHTAKFHLDRLCDDGLLQAEYRRLTGRTGPGAGRPAKLYRRADREFAVSLPERRYDLAAHILATAVQQAEGGAPLADSLRAAAYDEGRRLGAETSAAGPDLARLGQALATKGFEPRVEDDVLVLANCPFDSLAREHTALVCGLNQWYVQGTADGLGCQAVRADLAPAPGTCCIRARLSPPPPSAELRSDHATIDGSPRPEPAAGRSPLARVRPVPAYRHVRLPSALRDGDRQLGCRRRPAGRQSRPAHLGGQCGGRALPGDPALAAGRAGRLPPDRRRHRHLPGDGQRPGAHRDGQPGGPAPEGSRLRG